MLDSAPTAPVLTPPRDRLQALGRAGDRRKPEAGPAVLTARHKLLISYMIDGCQHPHLCKRIPVERKVMTEDGPATVTRHPNPGEPLSLIEAADMLRIRRRNARELMTLPIFKQAYDEELQRYRDGEKAASLRTLVEVRDDPGAGKAADRKVRVQAGLALLGEMGGGTNISVAVGVGVGMAPGYIIDLSEPDDPPVSTTIEHEAGR